MTAIWLWLKSFFASIEAALIAAVVVILCVWAAVATIRLNVAEKHLAEAEAAQAKAVAKAKSDALDEYRAQVETQSRIANELQRNLEKTEANRDAAADASRRLFQRYDANLAKLRALQGAAASGHPASASEAELLCADMYGKLVPRARTMEQRVRDLAGEADTLRPKAEGLQKLYESLPGAKAQP